MKVIIAAAGTAGHINPGLAIANKIKQEEKDWKNKIKEYEETHIKNQLQNLDL